MCHLSDAVNSLGLLLDVVGTLLLFKYGLPSAIREGESFEMEEFNEGKTGRESFNATVRKRAYRGLYCLVFGFAMQLIAT